MHSGHAILFLKRIRGRMHGMAPLFWLFATAPFLNAAPFALMLQPPRSSVNGSDLRDPAVRAEQTVALFLREWMEQEPTVRLMDEAQSASILREVLSPARRRKVENSLFMEVQRYTPVNAIVTWQWRAGMLSFNLHLEREVVPFSCRWFSPASAPAALAGITNFLTQALRLPLPNCPLGRTIPMEDGELLESVYMARRLRADWVSNSGEAQLELLRPFSKRQEPWVAAAILKAVTAMSTDRRNPQRPDQGVLMAQMALPFVLGTLYEAAAHEFLVHNRYQRDTIEQALLEMVRQSARDPLEAALDTPTSSRPFDSSTQDDVVKALAGTRTPGQITGAIRCLGTLRSRPALEFFEKMAQSDRAIWRQAVADALGRFESPVGRQILEKLATDSDRDSAFAALYALWKRKEPVNRETLITHASGQFKEHASVEHAVEVLACEAGKDALPILEKALESHCARCRAGAVQGILRLVPSDATILATLFQDVDGEVIRAVLGAISDPQVKVAEPHLMRLANHPDWTLAEASRRRLASLAPAEKYARLRFELGVEHPYVRHQILSELADDPASEAVTILDEACRNSDPYTRAHALQCLSKRQPESATANALQCLKDDHRWVILHAASLLANLARPGDADRLREAIKGEPDLAIRRHLEMALARAEGRSDTSAPLSAHRVPTDRTVVFLCGHGEEAPRSPIQGYYQLSYKPDEAARRAHAAGKIIFARANQTARNPAQVFLNERWRDRFWLGLEEEFSDLSALDGIVLGEESMYFRPFQQWEEGWRLFCREAKIDPERINGDREKLSESEKAAWWRWEQRVAIEGFNLIDEFIQKRFGVLKPGFQVCTFMPDQNGPCDFDRDWKFDVGAGYYYETNNRHRYTQIRRFKTIWPDRPVLWLVDATARSLHQPLNYRFSPPTNSVLDPGSPLFADALCAWMAGAHPGYFYARLAISKDMKPGPTASGIWVFLEDLYPGSRMLSSAVEHMFRGVEDLYRSLEGLKELRGAPDAALEPASRPSRDALLDDLMTDQQKEDPIQQRVKNEKERMRLGLLLERHLAWEWARILSDLPPPPPSDPVLLVGDMRAETGALRLPNSYDALHHINALAGQPLDRYRFLAAANGGNESVLPSARTNLLAWLRAIPGILYVHGRLDTEAQYLEWPWTSDVRQKEKGYELLADTAIPLEGDRRMASLVFWQGAGFRGGVVFDGGQTPLAVLRDHLNRLAIDRGIGFRFEGPIGIEEVALTGLKGRVSCRRATFEETVLQGVDPVTARRNPTLPVNRSGALVVDNFHGRHLIVTQGWVLVSESPLAVADCRATPEEVEIQANGLLRAMHTTGSLLEVGDDSNALPAISDDRFLSWLLESNARGYVRSRTPTGIQIWLRAVGRVRLHPAEKGRGEAP